MANRPFADGDWIYFKAYTGKAVVIAYDTERGKVYAENGHVFNQDDISYIRTPRKGSKEARDIVAMLASEYRKALARKKDDNESEFKRGARCKDKFSKHIIYRKAKSMLK